MMKTCPIDNRFLLLTSFAQLFVRNNYILELFPFSLNLEYIFLKGA